MTLKQRKFRIAIKQGANNVREAGRKAGYSDKSRTLYQNRTKTNMLIDQALPNEDEIVNDFVRIKALALEQNDLSNANRANESLARTKGMFTDKSEVNNTGNPDKIVISYVKQEILGSGTEAPPQPIAEPKANG